MPAPTTSSPGKRNHQNHANGAARHALEARRHAQTNPLLPGYKFNVYLVAGLTPIKKGGILDFFIDRPNGMEGYIINLTTRGQGIVHDGTTETHCKSGDLLLFPAGVSHYYGRDPDYAEWYHRWIYFRPRAYWMQWLDWPQKIEKIGRLSLSETSVQKEIDTLFRDIEFTLRRGTALAENLATNLLERLLLRCAEENMFEEERPIIDPRILHACHLISEHLFEDWSITQLARTVCLSPSRLEHLFRQQIGTTISRWREDQRLIRARQLLQVTQSPISVIAASVGYDDQLYFSRVFRKRIGISPSAFRKQALEKEG